jgi:hypothetical protein
MNVPSVAGFLNSGIRSIFGRAIPGANSTNNSFRTSIGADAGRQPSDDSQLSPLAQILGTLQQLQQSNPGQYQRLTQVIASNLTQTAQQSGNSVAANQLTQLATDFTNASNTGSLPNIADLANVIGGTGGSGDQGVGGDSYAGSASQQLQESSLSVQISFSETSITNAVQDAPLANNNPVGGAATSGGSQAQRQFQESSLSYQLNLSEVSTNDAIQGASSNTGATASGQPSAGNQPSPLEAQQLIGLVAQSLQNAVQTAQSSGNSTEADLLTQLATYFTNGLNAGGQANTQAPTDATAAGGSGQHYLQGTTVDSYGGSSGNTSEAGSSTGSQVLQQFQESMLSYQINFSESSTNGSTTSQEAFSLSATSLSLSAVF